MARLTWETRAGRVVLSSCGAVVALALIAGGYYWWGGPHERSVARQVLDEACRGVLPAPELRAVLGDGPYRSGPGRSGLRDADRPEEHDGGGIRQESCSVSRDTEHHAGHPTRDASVDVDVRRVRERATDGASADRPADLPGGSGPLYPTASTELPPAALGHGWRGLFSTEESYGSSSADGTATAAVLLECARDGGLLVTVGVKEEDVTLDDPRRRTAYARIATATAAKAAEKWGCDADLGKPLRTVALPVDRDEDVPLADASGTCRGVPGRGGRMTRAWEGARSGSPVEVCVVASGRPGVPIQAPVDDAQRYHLVAYYGPYAETQRLDHEERRGRYSGKPGPGDAVAGRFAGGGHWASATCPGGAGPALFTVRDDASERNDYAGLGKHHPAKPSASDLAYERAALKEFAKRSARAHGCGAPKLP
ncbi:hypothetical protein ABZ953_18480 [Streptomyces sp. NPDC046465]|uniref:hypothetical protein n=1 Tax=Streptomyces sp. NPDC046465 TaxID=3155810 RepID=UPI0033EB9AA4